ncbi:hypothetical protein H6G80_21620 [Nostoc sp. FACHB-87]|uniref:hypothetical protein n=1 Tax=Nostocaceae TaxID=1162 RepID=UPI001682B25D|nr:MULTISPECIES: hypothetical protein [Nostocaceae]MBD2456666.1 hypothetical protein [Nostoc sp. FACHB-87]MBD2478081.1 hypothetical protein [Anabaena sp. FACHB-83]
MKNLKSVGLPIIFGTLISGFIGYPIALASEIEKQDIILSANGAAGSQDWEYNASRGQGWVRYKLDWQPDGRIKSVSGKCVDNCKNDARKFQYRLALEKKKIILYMKVTNELAGLIRVEVSAVVN